MVFETTVQIRFLFIVLTWSKHISHRGAYRLCISALCEFPLKQSLRKTLFRRRKPHTVYLASSYRVVHAESGRTLSRRNCSWIELHWKFPIMGTAPF